MALGSNCQNNECAAADVCLGRGAIIKPYNCPHPAYLSLTRSSASCFPFPCKAAWKNLSSILASPATIPPRIYTHACGMQIIHIWPRVYRSYTSGGYEAGSATFLPRLHRSHASPVGLASLSLSVNPSRCTRWLAGARGSALVIRHSCVTDRIRSSDAPPDAHSRACGPCA